VQSSKGHGAHSDVQMSSETLDGISDKFIEKLSESIKDCTYKFKPSRRVEISG